MSTYQQPDASGHFGPYGGSFVSETLTHAIEELNEAYAKYQHDLHSSPSSSLNWRISSAVPHPFTMQPA